MIDLKRLLVIGANSAISQELPFGIKLKRNELDVTDNKTIESAFLKYNPSAVLCLASIDLHNCEKNPSLACTVNVKGIYNVGMECLKRNIPIIMVSTGAIFSGKAQDKFNELSIPKPLNLYGNTKYLAELFLQKITKDYLIVRTGWLFGFNHKKTGFSKFIESALTSKDLSNLIATDDLRGSPTYIQDFVKELEKLISSGAKGIFHITNSGDASAYEVAQQITKITNKENSVRRVKTNFNVSLGIPLRSQSECLTSSKLKLRSWEDALKDYSNNLNN